MKHIYIFLILVVLFSSCATTNFETSSIETVARDSVVIIIATDGSLWVFKGDSVQIEIFESTNKIIGHIDGKLVTLYNVSVIVVDNGLQSNLIYPLKNS